MSALLRLRIDAEWPARTLQCEWALYDLRGDRVERGQSDPSHWPAAENCELVLSADQCLVLDAQMPKGLKGDDSKAVGYLVEDRVLGDINNEHVVAGDTRADGTARVWVVSRTRLNSVLSALSQLGRAPRRAFSELQLVPVAPECWSVCIQEAKGFVRFAEEAGFAFDVSGSDAPAELSLAVQAASTSSTMPQRIDVYSSLEARFDSSAWQSTLGVPVHHAGEYAWDAQPTRSVRNLLVGEFTPARGRHSGWAPFKPGLWIGAAALLVYTVFSFGEWAWMSQRASDLRVQSIDIFRTAFPQMPTVVDPALQMQRLYDEQMRERGRLGQSDFLPLLAAVSDSLPSPASYRSLAYEEGRLEFTLMLPDARTAERLREALSRRGLTPTLRGSRQTRSGIETSFSVRSGT